MVSHDIDRALEYTDNVIELEGGKIIFTGKPSEFKLGGAK